MSDKPLRFAFESIFEANDIAGELYARFNRRKVKERKLLPSDVGLDYHASTICAKDGQALSAWYIPSHPKVHRIGLSDLAVYVGHHYGGQKATVLPWLQFFHRMGIDALTLDMRGHGASSLDDMKPHRFSDHIFDVDAACEFLKEKGAKRILLLGSSQGAASVIGVAAKRDDIAGVILDSGPAPAMLLAAWGLAGEIKGEAEGLVVQSFIAASILSGGKVRGYSRRLYQALKKLRDKPLLLIHGKNDSVIPYWQVLLWFKGVKASQKWQHLRHDGGHLFNPSSRTEITAKIEAFLKTSVCV